MKSTEKYDCLPQFLSALAVSLCGSVVGGWMSFTSVAIPKMMNNTSQNNLSAVLDYQDPISIDLHEGSHPPEEGDGGHFDIHVLSCQVPGLPVCSSSGTSWAVWPEGSST